MARGGSQWLLYIGLKRCFVHFRISNGRRQSEGTPDEPSVNDVNKTLAGMAQIPQSIINCVEGMRTCNLADAGPSDWIATFRTYLVYL